MNNRITCKAYLCSFDSLLLFSLPFFSLCFATEALLLLEFEPLALRLPALPFLVLSTFLPF